MISYTFIMFGVLFVKLHGLRTALQMLRRRGSELKLCQGWKGGIALFRVRVGKLIGLELWCEIQAIAIVRQHAHHHFSVFHTNRHNHQHFGQWSSMMEDANPNCMVRLETSGDDHVSHKPASSSRASQLANPPNVLLVEYFQVYPSLACARWARTRYKWS